jgi:hypothetical protein
MVVVAFVTLTQGQLARTDIVFKYPPTYIYCLPYCNLYQRYRVWLNSPTEHTFQSCQDNAEHHQHWNGNASVPGRGGKEVEIQSTWVGMGYQR